MPAAVDKLKPIRAQVMGAKMFVGSPIQEHHLSPEVMEWIRQHPLKLNPKPVPDPAPAAEPAAPPPLPDHLDWSTGTISFSGGVPVGGWGNLTLRQNGDFAYSGHFHVSGAPSYNAELIYIIVGLDGTAFAFRSNVHLAGTFESGSRDGDWNQTGNNAQIAAHWPQLCAQWHSHWTANVNWDVDAAVNAAVQAIKAAGTVVAAVIAVV